MRHALLLSLLLVAGVAGAAEPPTKRSALAARIDAGEAPLVLDVRTPEEFAAGHVPGAVLIPHDQLATRIGELGAPREVVVYCRSGRRSGLAEAVLEQRGFRVSQLEGSWLAWEAQGLPIETGTVAEPAR